MPLWKRIRGVYAIWPDLPILNRLIQAGINTVMLPFHHIPSWPDPPNGYFDTFDYTIEVARQLRAAHHDLRIIAVAPWIEEYMPEVEHPYKVWSMLGVKEYRRTPCPTHGEYAKKISNCFLPYRRIAWKIDAWLAADKAYDLPKEHLYDHMDLFDAVYVDLEPYGIHRRHDVTNLWDDNVAGACRCQQCSTVYNTGIDDLENQRQILATTLASHFEGQLCFDHPTLLQDGPRVLVSERYYREVKWNRPELRNKVRYGKPWYEDNGYKFLPGVWADWFWQEDLLKYLRRMSGWVHADGWWIFYNQRFTTRWPRLPGAEKDWPGPFKTEPDINFYYGLRQLIQDEDEALGKLVSWRFVKRQVLELSQQFLGKR